MTGTPTNVMIGLREILSLTMGDAFSGGAAAYRSHELPVGGIELFPAVRINEVSVTPDDICCQYEHEVELWVLHENTAIVASGRANIADTLYTAQAEIMHAIVDEERTSGKIGGVLCKVTRVGRATMNVDETEGWMIIPITLSYARLAGEV